LEELDVKNNSLQTLPSMIDYLIFFSHAVEFHSSELFAY